MNDTKFWFLVHDGHYVVAAYPNATELMNFIKLKDMDDVAYVFMLCSPAAAAVANDQSLEDDPKLSEFSCITINGMAVLLWPGESLMDGDVVLSKVIDFDWIAEQVKEIYGEADIEKALKFLAPKPEKVVVDRPDNGLSVNKETGLVESAYNATEIQRALF